MKRFRGQTVVVTGASSGIGRAVALALQEEEASLILIGRDENRLSEVAAACRPDTSVVSCKLDLARSFEELPPSLRDRGVDILVHCAGRLVIDEMISARLDDFDLQMGVNVRGPWMLSRLLLPQLIEARGQIVFVNSSIAQHSARAGHGAYAASKVALRAIADSLREEVNALGVRVTSVYPGRTATSMQENLHAQEGRDYRPERLLQPEDLASIILHVLTLPETAEVRDVSVRPFMKT